MTTLKTIRSPLGSAEYPIESDEIFIGRHPDCEIHLNHGGLSRRHAKIYRDEEGYVLEDLQSINGTKVNGRRLHGKRRLFNGDRIQICDIEFLFESDLPGAQIRSTRPAGWHRDAIFLDDQPQDHPVTITSKIDLRSTESSGLNFTSIDGKVNWERQAHILQTKMETMLRMSKTLSDVFSVRELLPQFLDNLLQLFRQADFACLLAMNSDSKQLEIVDFKSRDLLPGVPFKTSRSVPQYVYENQMAILSNDVQDDSRFDPSESVFGNSIRSVMAVPIIDNATQAVIRVIQIDSRTGDRQFDSADLDLLVMIAAQVGIQYENMKLREERHKEEMTLKDLRFAHEVQRGFLPDTPPKLAGYEFSDFYQPAKMLGGDYYDYILLPDGKLAVVVGDVAGKGIAAALLMAKLSADTRYALLREQNPGRVMTRLNQIYSERRTNNRFVTFVLLVIDPSLHEIRVANAGHCFPILRLADGTIQEIGKGRQGFPLGVVPTTAYEEVAVPMSQGDAVFLMTDGLSDAMNSTGELFHQANVNRVIQEQGGGGATAAAKNIMDAVRQFIGPTSQSDDQCLVAFSRNQKE